MFWSENLHTYALPAPFALAHLPCSPLQVFGFVVSVVFIVDIIFFWRTHDFPIKKDKKEEFNKAVAAAQAPPPEAERLNIATDAAE